MYLVLGMTSGRSFPYAWGIWDPLGVGRLRRDREILRVLGVSQG